jgi:hypothetical protein
MNILSIQERALRATNERYEDPTMLAISSAEAISFCEELGGFMCFFIAVASGRIFNFQTRLSGCKMLAFMPRGQKKTCVSLSFVSCGASLAIQIGIGGGKTADGHFGNGNRGIVVMFVLKTRQHNLTGLKSKPRNPPNTSPCPL